MSSKKEYLVGINYFSGWWRQTPNKYMIDGDRDWRMDYPGRTALLGCYNDQETMDAEIKTASQYGVDFQILWYVETPERHPNGEMLNNGLRQFMASRENGKMKFTVEFCNHPPFEIVEDKLWAESCRIWVEAMKHCSYLRIGGKAVFKVHGFNIFMEQCDNDLTKASHRIEMLRHIAKDEGVGPLLIGAGSVPSDLEREDWNRAIGIFDYVATYMDVPDMPRCSED